jgi:penicillin-binding protein 1A
MWISFLREAQQGLPTHRLPPPPGIVTMRISPETGLPARAGEPDAIFESFVSGNVPEAEATRTAAPGLERGSEDVEDEDDSLF